jgi:hypothetical protein
MKKFMVLVIIGIAMWWGFKQVSRKSSTEHVSTGNIISAGEKVDLKQHLVSGKYTVFFFFANW